MNDGGGNGTSCGGIKVSTDTTKLSNMVTASFGGGRNMIGKRKVFIQDKANVASRVSVLSEELCILSSCFLSPMSRNSVLEEWRVKRLAVIQEEIC